MARYYTGSLSDQESLIDAIDTVLTDGSGLGWSQDELDDTNEEAGWNDGADLFVQASWDNSADITLHQSTAWDGAGTAPGSHTGDSGSSHALNAIGNSLTAYHAFTNDGAGNDFAYFVVEYDTGFYRHFGMGSSIDKAGTFTGGAFLYGQQWDQGGSIDDPNQSLHSTLFDVVYSLTDEAATIRLSGMPNQAGHVWGISSTKVSLGNDPATNPYYRVQGGSRGGPFVQVFGFIDASASDAFIPGCPVPVIAKDDSHSGPEHWYWLGELPSVFIGSMSGFVDEEEITIGGETWIVFPLINSSYSAGSGLEQSGNAGVFYRKA